MRRAWNAEEIDYLKDHIGFYKMTTIAETMGRSLESIRVKMNRLGLSNTKLQTGLLTIGELAKLLKVDRNTIKWWIQKYDLPYKKKVTRESKSFYLIDSSDFWKWAKLHKNKVQFSNIDSRALLPEPEWVEEERRKDQQVVKKKVYKFWTTKEDQRLLQFRKEGLTYVEIGKRMDRSSISVERRYKRITHS